MLGIKKSCTYMVYVLDLELSLAPIYCIFNVILQGGEIYNFSVIIHLIRSLSNIWPDMSDVSMLRPGYLVLGEGGHTVQKIELGWVLARTTHVPRT